MYYTELKNVLDKLKLALIDLFPTMKEKARKREVTSIARKLDLIVQKLDALVRLGVLEMAQGKSQAEQIWLYSVAGLQPREIAEVLGTTRNTVRVTLFNLRKSRKSKRRSQGV